MSDAGMEPPDDEKEAAAAAAGVPSICPALDDGAEDKRSEALPTNKTRLQAAQRT